MLPKPLDPMADDAEPVLEPEDVELDDEVEVEPEELDPAPEVLPVGAVLLNRLVAAVNADEAFDAELLTGELPELLFDELVELEAVELAEEEEVLEEPRP